MRITVIPAQVTTVEDTIAGNLSLTQILLLIAPVMLSTAIYAVLPQQMAFTGYKIPIMAVVSFVFVILSLKIKGRLVLHWLNIFIEYALRPHLYVFNKNTLVVRDFVVHSTVKKNAAPIKLKKPVPKQDVAENPGFDYESLLRNTAVNVSFTRKGLLVVKNYD